MRISRSFINFASVALGFTVLLLGATGCKGRTLDNVEPTGDTIEVVIEHPQEIENQN